MNNSLNKVEYYPLSHPQKAIWYTEKMYPGTSIGNVAGTLRIKGEVDFELLEKAINIFVQKNDGMRLRVVEIDGQPMQYISEFSKFKVDFWDFSNIGDIEALYKWDDEQTKKPLKFVDSDLFYFALVKVNDHDGGFYVKTHHLISDAWTMTIIGNQVIEYYTELKGTKEISNESKPSYIDYILSEDVYKQSHRYEKDKEFWDKKFEIVPEMTTLKTRTSNYIHTEAKRKTFLAPIKFTHKLREYSAENKISVFSLFMSALCMYINRISNKEDIVLGTSILNRMNTNEKNTAGMFISTAPVRVNIEENLDFKTLSQNISKETMALMRHQKYPYDLLLKEVREKHSILDNLYDIALSYQNSKFNKGEHAEDYETRWHFNGHQTNSLTIHINDREDEGHLIIDYDFLSNLFYVKEIEFIHQHIISLLWHAIDNPSQKISKIEILSEREKRKILYEFNNTDADYPRDKTIHQVFEEQVGKTPDSVAVVFEEQKLTYNELNQKANSLARDLRSCGINCESIVGLMIDRSLEMIVGILAVLKAGGAYLPIDPAYPVTRIEYMLKDAGAQLLLTKKELGKRINFNGQLVDLEDKKGYSKNDSNLESISGSKNLAYIMYTSGSTGSPKGVMVEHSSVINLWNWFSGEYLLYKDQNVINLATYTFDVSVEEIIVPLLCGATVFIPKKETILDKKAMTKYMNQNKINIAQFVPSHLREILLGIPKIPSLDAVICGGESLDQQLNEDIISLGYNLYNHYGPTEITVDALTSKCSKDKVMLGKPINNCKCYILDKKLNPVPIGIAGEVYISGDGVTRGYKNRPDLTKKAFIPNPFESGEKMYKTGDLARWYPRGDIEYLGRVDEQVKIRGHRVELNEIKFKLLNYVGIKDAVVLDRSDKNKRKYLCAYIVAATEIAVSELRTYLSNELADYMVPTHFIILDKIPLNQNGKIDIKLLREMNAHTRYKTEYVEPRDEIEEKISQIWSEILGIEQIGINDDFFELGGDSLSVINMVSRIEKLTNKQIPISSIYENKTVNKIAMFIKNEETNILQNDVTLLRKGTSDKNIFFIHGGSGSIGGYSNIFRDNDITLNEEFNCYAIKFDKLDGYSPTKISIEELAHEYIKRILSIQPDGEYRLAAWCIGGQIVYEMATILQDKLNKKVSSVIMFNSIAPREWDIYYSFEINSEIMFIREILGETFEESGVKSAQSVQELWQHIIEVVKDRENEIKEIIPRDILLSIPNYQSLSITDIIYFINVMRSLHNARVNYYPKNKLRAQMYFFQPLRDTTINDHEENVNAWQKHCEKKVHRVEVDADEHTIFDEDINNTIKMLNVILGRG